MSDKKGFVLIETIVTITVLSISLLYIYSSFNGVLLKEKTRVNYDDAAYIYRTYYVKKFFKNYELSYVLGLLNSDNPLIIIGCDYEGIFNENATAETSCGKLINDLKIKNIAVALNDLSYINDCNETNTSDKCLYLNNFSLEEETYFRTLGKLNTSGDYIMLIEYEDDAINERNYAWVEI